MVARQLPLPGSIVKKSNALSRAHWPVESIYEPRLVALVASKVRKDDKDFHDYEIPVSEIIGTGADGRTYKLIEDAVDGLLGRIITIPKEHGWAKFGIFSYCEYDSKKGVVKARFDPAMKPHYIGLKEKFTEYSLIEYLILPSTYSQRIFEFLKSWDDQPERVEQLPDLQDMLDVPESLKANFKDFRRRVLEKAHRDISRNTSLVYEWEPIKKGRAVVAVRFVFTGPRIAGATEKKTAQENTKTKKANNQLFTKVMDCFRVKGGDCKEVLGKKHCEFCRSVNQKEEKK